AAWSRSARFTPAAVTLMRISPGAGVTSGTDCHVSCPSEVATIASIRATLLRSGNGELSLPATAMANYDMCGRGADGRDHWGAHGERYAGPRHCRTACVA